MKQKLKWVEELPPRLPERPMPDELSRILAALKEEPGMWAEVKNEEYDSRSDQHVYIRRVNYLAHLDRRGITDYEFAVRNGVLYGRFLGSA